MKESKSANKSLAVEDCSHPVAYIDTRWYASDVKRKILQFFKYTLKHCPNCGALIPELKIQHKDRTYAFCCYSVNEYEKDEKLSTPDFPVSSDTKVVIQTDYAKLRDYLNKRAKEGSRLNG